MLATIFIDPECLHMSNFIDDAASEAVTQAFIDAWMNYGVLIRPKNQSYLEYLDSVRESMYPQSEIVFTKALSRGRSFHYHLAIEPSVPFRDLADVNLSLRSEVVLISFNAATIIPLIGSSTVRNFGTKNIEAIRFDCLSLSSVLRRVSMLARAPVKTGENRDEIWRKRFEMLSSFSKSILIDDKWCIKRLLDQHAYVKNRYSRHDYHTQMASTNGLCYIISKLGSKLRSSSLTIYSSYENRNQLEIAKSILIEFLPKEDARDSIIELRATHEGYYPDHDRFIRFDDIIVTLGSGLEIFDHSTTKKSHQSTMIIQNEEFRDIETELIRICKDNENL